MPKEKQKKVSLAKAARTYKRNTKPTGDFRDAATGKKFSGDGRIPVTPAPRVSVFKPKAKSVTLGVDRKGNPGTRRKTGRV